MLREGEKDGLHMMKVVVMFTCFNRKEKTIKAVQTLSSRNRTVDFSFIIVDDNSNDGTYEALTDMKADYDIHLIRGSGNLYYSRGMRMGMEYAKSNLKESVDYLLMINDDVEFYDGCIEKLITKSRNKKDAVIVGCTEDCKGIQSYGAIKYLSTRSIKYRMIAYTEENVRADTFNANCVLIPYHIFIANDIMDSVYLHSVGDFDYGLCLSKRGCAIYSSDCIVGICNKNSSEKTWQDTKLSRRERLQAKESPKGAPFKQWFYFLKKNFGVWMALKHGFTPFVRIILRR